MPSSENLACFTNKYLSNFYYWGMIMFYYSYVMQSVKKGNLYVGYTINLKQRLKEHNQGLNKSTKSYRPWRLVYHEACLNEKDAKRREHYLKTSQGQRLLKRRLKEYFFRLKG